MTNCKFVSVWDGGVTVVTEAEFDEKTGEVTADTAEVCGLQTLEREFIELPNGDEIEVCPDCHEYILKTVMEPDAEGYSEVQHCSNPECEEMMDTIYIKCAFCDHFVEPNSDFEKGYSLAAYIHLDDGEKDHDHDADPRGGAHTLEEWKALRPDFFKKHEDGKIGPNSQFHPSTKEIRRLTVASKRKKRKKALLRIGAQHPAWSVNPDDKLVFIFNEVTALAREAVGAVGKDEDQKADWCTKQIQKLE